MCITSSEIFFLQFCSTPPSPIDISFACYPPYPNLGNAAFLTTFTLSYVYPYRRSPGTSVLQTFAKNFQKFKFIGISLDIYMNPHNRNFNRMLSTIIRQHCFSHNIHPKLCLSCIDLQAHARSKFWISLPRVVALQAHVRSKFHIRLPWKPWNSCLSTRIYMHYPIRKIQVCITPNQHLIRVIYNNHWQSRQHCFPQELSTSYRSSGTRHVCI